MNLFDKFGALVNTFNDGHETFKKDTRAKNSLNKLLNTDFKAVYRQEGNYKKFQWKHNKIDCCGEKFYVVTSKDKVVEMFNSEWCWFKEV